jgi:hypothetical protein
MVLCLAGVVPAGALAQESRQQAQGQQAQGQQAQGQQAQGQQAQGQQAQGQQAQAPRETSDEALQQQITELWQGYRMLQQEVDLLRAQVQEPGQAPAVGGSGQGGTAAGGAGQGLFIVELPAGDDEAGVVGGSGGSGSGQSSQSRIVGQTGQGQSGQATGGSGTNAGGMQGSGRAISGDVIVGTVRSISQDRLLLADPMGRVFEFDLTRQSRVIGPRGVFAPTQVLEEGTPVRAVAEGGNDERADVRDIYIVTQAPSAR